LSGSFFVYAERLVAVDSGESAEYQAANVGEVGGAASGDAVAGQEIVKMVKRVVDGLGVLETVFALHEWNEEIDVFVASFLLGFLAR